MHLLRSLPPFLAAVLAGALAAQHHREPPKIEADSSFAIVVDRATWTAIPDPIRRYRDAVEADGLATWILVDDWSAPEVVRDALSALHRGTSGSEGALEGAILVGRIPVAMFRGAQHLTTAFKMDEEKYPRGRSSVPSDRFYEDFDLVLEPLENDPEQPLLHYYRLAPASPQRIDKEIYTARLCPAAAPGDTAATHAAIAACLERFAQRERQPPVLDRALTLMGHGYVSESLEAWADNRVALGEQVQALRQPGGTLVTLHHHRDAELERILLRELSDPKLDLAILHSHGDDDRQYLIGAPPLRTAAAKVASLRKYLRDRLRRARTRGESEADAQRKLAERFQIPVGWFADAFDDAVTHADAELEGPKELEAVEVSAIACGAEVVDLDACFNGAFVAVPYQAGAYLFGTGTTLAVVANSVNVAQDVWNDRQLGVLARGGRVGAWHRARPHLESHLFGDPTFRFAAPPDDAIAARQQSTAKLPKTPEAAAQLLALLRSDPAAVVRLEALAQLARRRGRALIEALPIAARDPFEPIRRAAVSLMGDCDHPGFMAPLVYAALRDPSQRVAFKARGALGKYDAAAVALAFDAAQAALLLRPDGDRAKLLRGLQTAAFLDEYCATAKDRSKPLAKRRSAIRTFRLYRVHRMVPELLALAAAADDEPAVRSRALEALGWYVYSSWRARIIAAAEKIAADESAPAEVRAEARKTVRRLQEGANDPLLP